MEDVPYNGKQINGTGFTANPVELPAAEAVVEFVVFERNSVTLSGGVTIAHVVLGDISKITPLGIGTLDFSVSLNAELTRSQTIYFGASEAGFSLDSAGALTLLALFPASTLSYEWETTGQLTRVGFLNGAITQTQDLSGAMVRQRSMNGTTTVETSNTGVLGAIQYMAGLSEKNLNATGSIGLFRPNYIGYGFIEMSIGFEGNLTNVGRLSGSTGLSSDMAGQMINTKILSGDTGIQWNVAGLLANNAGVMDLKGFLMIRRKTNREMLR